MSRDTSRSGRVPTVETQGPGLGGTPRVRSFPGRGPGSENHAHHPPHPSGCFRCRLGHVVDVGHSDVARGACRRRSGAPPDPAVRGGAGRREVDRRASRLPMAASAARSRSRRTASWPWPRRTTPQQPSRPCPTWRPTPTPYITASTERRRSGSAGSPDPGCARNERRPDQLRGDEPPGEAAGHRADVGSRRRTVRDGDAVDATSPSAATSRASSSPRSRQSGRRPTRRRSAG